MTRVLGVCLEFGLSQTDVQMCFTSWTYDASTRTYVRSSWVEESELGSSTLQKCVYAFPMVWPVRRGQPRRRETMARLWWTRREGRSSLCWGTGAHRFWLGERIWGFCRDAAATAGWQKSGSCMAILRSVYVCSRRHIQYFVSWHCASRDYR